MNIKKIVFGVIIIACFGGFFYAGLWWGVNKVAYHVPQPGTVDFSLFWDAYGKLQKSFINPEKIDNKKVIYGAIEGMTKSLGDPYTGFFDPQQAKKFQADLAGSFEGIGAEIGIKKDMLTIVAPLKGTPAQKAGLKAGDVITKIDGKTASDMTTDEAVNLIRGAKGTTVVLDIFREGWNDTKEFRITRDTIKLLSMEWSVKDENIAYIQIFQFDQSLPDDFRQSVREILQSNAEKIVLDLRNNPGGYLDVAQDIAGFFLQKSQVVTIEDFGGNREKVNYESQGNGELLKYPIIILINKGSASASEILAGALRDNRGVKLVGEKSFGKGSVQEVVDMRDGSFLKITIAKWLTPKGNSISEVGLEPDVKIEISDKDIESEKDPQLDKALEIANSLK